MLHLPPPPLISLTVGEARPEDRSSPLLSNAKAKEKWACKAIPTKMQTDTKIEIVLTLSIGAKQPRSLNIVIIAFAFEF